MRRRRVTDSLHRLEDRHWWFRGRRAVIEALLDRAELPLRSRILDAGCGTGSNMAELAYLGEVTGVDESAGAVNHCRKRGLLDVSQAALPQLPFEDRSFELLLLADVLERTEDDVRALLEMRRVATDDAHLLITAPAYQWLWSDHDRAHRHRRRYTRRRLTDAVQRGGWETLTVTYFNSILFPAIGLVRKLVRPFAFKERDDTELTPGLDGILQLPMRLEAGVIRHGLRLPFGVSVGALCRAAPVRRRLAAAREP